MQASRLADVVPRPRPHKVLHAEDPGSLTRVLSSPLHGVHTEAPAISEYVPCTHGLQVPEAPSLTMPGLHAVHAAFPEDPRPAGQTVEHAEELGPLTRPSEHGVHAEAADTFEKVPGGQAWQRLLAVERKVPGAQ